MLVAAGTYDKTPYQMAPWVDLWGGFEPDSWRRVPHRHATILDGGDRSRCLNGADHAALDGFVVRGGQVRDDGGAVLCRDVSPILRNNWFVANRTKAPSNWQPRHLHENAHNGGAVAVLEGAAPTIEHNLFVDNQTEAGRGAAIAFDSRSKGVVRGNVFLNNLAGRRDPKRSSDGGAVSVFDWSHPRIVNNLFIRNEASNRNDGGGLFVALWSSPQIVGNLFVGNRSDDDGGALFLGGQEHRYERPQDPTPEEDQYAVVVRGNQFYGNANRGGKSGGLRIAMQARAILVNNLFSDQDPVQIQDSDAALTHNTLLGNVVLNEFVAAVHQRTVANNIIRGQLTHDGKTPLIHCNAPSPTPGRGNFTDPPLVDRRRMRLFISESKFDERLGVTELTLAARQFPQQSLAGRVVDASGHPTVVRSHTGQKMTVWGDPPEVDQLDVLPTFALLEGSPCIDRGAQRYAAADDLQGQLRPAGEGVDVGADEFLPTPPSENSPDGSLSGN